MGKRKFSINAPFFKNTIMRKILLSLVIALISTGFAIAQTKIIISAKNYKAEKINIAWQTDNGEYNVKGIEIKDGKGEITIDAPEGKNINLASLDPRSRITMGQGIMPGPGFAFYAEKGTIKISFDADQWPILTIEGGALSKDCNNYWGAMAPIEKASFELTGKRFAQGDPEKPNLEMDNERERLAKENDKIQHNFIVNNPGSLLALDILSQRFMKYSLDEFEKLFTGLSKSVKESVKGKAVAERIAAAKATQPGKPAPKFSKKDKDGKIISLDNLKGKYVLIDFWGTWCQPCRASHPHLVQLYNKYSPMGLVFINVAQEGNLRARDKWLKAIEDDGLVWTQILNDEDIDDCNMVNLFSIQAFPSKVLIDPQGNIIKTWIGDSPEVDAKLKEIYGK